jgi:hypothetical protein
MYIAKAVAVSIHSEQTATLTFCGQEVCMTLRPESKSVMLLTDCYASLNYNIQ